MLLGVGDRRDFFTTTATAISFGKQLLLLANNLKLQRIINDTTEGINYLDQLVSSPSNHIPKEHPFRITVEYDPITKCHLPTSIRFDPKSIDKAKVKKAYNSYKKFEGNFPAIFNSCNGLPLAELKKIFPEKQALALFAASRDNDPASFISVLVPDNDVLFCDLLDYNSAEDFIKERLKNLAEAAQGMLRETIDAARFYARFGFTDELKAIDSQFKPLIATANTAEAKGVEGKQEKETTSKSTYQPNFTEDYYKQIYACRQLKPEMNPFNLA